MQALSGSAFLQLWEQGRRLHPLDRGLLALSAAAPGSSWDELADLPLGERNRGLAALHNACFGPRMEVWVSCPECGETLECDPGELDLASTSNAAKPSVVVGGHVFRLPTSRDLASVAREPDASRAVRQLVERCRLNPAIEPLSWSGEQVDELGEQMARADPLAETQLALACECCGHRWAELLDLSELLWTKIERRVRQLLLEVHTLASTYGWSEAEILALSEQRRALYLEMSRE